MPMFTLRTTVARIPDNFYKETATLLGQLLGKPAEVRISFEISSKQNHFQVCLIMVHPGMAMSMGGSNDPCGHIILSSIGKISRDENMKYAKPITDHVCSKFGIDKKL
jgi:hypothetical protein